NRTVAEVRSAFNKGGGNLGETGCVAWMFERLGQFAFDRNQYTEDQILEVALEAGADDVIDRPDEGIIEVRCAPEAFFQVQQAFEKAGLKPLGGEITWIPKNTVEVSGEKAEKVLRLIERLEELDDVQNVYANYEISAEELAKLAA
ncbi:MAG: YebC/PmpR family DNA-binding transcriptional regulator, partial [Zetaproteobacteria bacterium]